MKIVDQVKARFTGRPDTEHEQALVRVVIGVVLGTYLLLNTNHSSGWIYASGAYLVVIPAFMLAAFSIVACIIAWPQASPARRVIANAIDVVTLTFIMIVGEELTAPVFFIYLWVTFGCGFRYGARYLQISLLLSTAGFTLVLGASDYWAQNRALGIGLLGGMILLSLYVLVLIRRLHEAVERAEAANQAKRTFVSSVSHELRTPLNAIIGMNDLLGTTTLNSEQAEMVGTMRGASRIMLSLIEDVLDFSKIEAGKITVESVDFDLHSLLQSTLTIFSRQAAMKGLKLGVFVMPEVTHALRGDVYHLQQILVNLIGNAVKFTERGEVQLTVSSLIESQQSVRLRFTVRDTGIGIPLEDQERIFESFAQAGAPSARRHRGTGLGTTIAKQIVELMGGTIGLESAPGAGSTFWFDLSLAKQATADATRPERFKHSRVLLVGFPLDVARTLMSDLQQWELNVSDADSVALAVARLSEATALGRAYRAALVYEDGSQAEIGNTAVALRTHNPVGLPLVLCAPSAVVQAWGSRVPAEFTSLIAIPAEKRLLYNALHSVLAGDEVISGAVSLTDYYQRKEPTKAYRILVADDDPVNRRVIEKQLGLGGHGVKLVTDGEQALDALGEADYDVIILDSHMPVMTGLEATRLIRVMQAGRANVPIIMFSADATPEAIQEATDAGVSAFLSKPLQAARLFATIEQLAEKRSAREPAKVVRAIAPQQRAQAPLLNTHTLHDLERMSQDPQFVQHLVKLFSEDSSQLLLKIREALLHHRQEEFKSHVHALKGSALNVGAERLFVHCVEIGALNYREIATLGGSLAADTHAVLAQTQAALADHVKNRSAASS